MFYEKGFICKKKKFTPCRVAYHAECIKVGHPFRTRHYGKGTKGIQYPPCATIFPFICEVCTTRTHLGRELDPLNTNDTMLLMLERMRMIDAAHAWDHKTIKGMCNTIKKMESFFQSFSLPSIHQQLQLPILSHPPLDFSIPLFWSMEHYTTTPSRRSRETTPTWNTGRVQRSAISLYSSWWAAFCNPSTIYKDKERRLLSDINLGPSENILSRMTAGGMATRLGTESRPSQALNQRHILWNQEARKRILNDKDLTLMDKYLYTAAQCSELILWLGWLRSTEVFHLRREDVELTPPHNHGKYNLPPGVGAILLRLLPSTKSLRDKQADMVIAWKTSGGLQLGFWLTQLLSVMEKLNWVSSHSYIFRNERNTPWTSYYFRTHHLYPNLLHQFNAKDPLLCHLSITPNHGVEWFYYSLHSYRRGAQSHCLRQRPGCTRASFPHERVEHGRWRIKNKGIEDMPTHYTEASVEDRIYITLLCF